MEGVKEYLVKAQGDNWVFTTELTGDLGDEVFEIPEGTDLVVKFSNEGIAFFKNKNPRLDVFVSGLWESTSWKLEGLINTEYLKKYADREILWQRQEKPLEYLDPSDWSLKFIRGTDDAAPKNWILVPEGADTLAGNKESDYHRYFWNHTSKKMIGTGESLKRYQQWEDDAGVTARVWLDTISDDKYGILWQRHTLPDDLPFIDDHPPAHFVVRPKPRVRAYATLGRRVISHINLTIEVSA